MIYTIGYGNRKVEDFIQILKEFDIQYLIDIRSQPYSKFNPNFSQSLLKRHLINNRIIYAFLGYELGGRPDSKNCYNSEGKIDYEKVKVQDFFKLGISRIEIAYMKQLKVVLMCSESKPEECHRTKLIGEVLASKNINICHIDEKYRLRTHTEIILKLTRGKNTVDLFGNKESFTSRKKYLK